MPGTTAVHCVALTQVTPVAGMPLKVKVVPPGAVLKPVPVSVTVVPVVPLPGAIRVSSGKTANLNSSLEGALVMPSTVTVRWTGTPTLPDALSKEQSVVELPQLIFVATVSDRKSTRLNSSHLG